MNDEKKQDENGGESREETKEIVDYPKETHGKVSDLYDKFMQARLLEYIELVQSPGKLFWRNFLAGVGKGLGLTIGTAIILAFLFKVVQHMIELNIPYITEWISELALMIKKTLSQ